MLLAARLLVMTHEVSRGRVTLSAVDLLSHPFLVPLRQKFRSVVELLHHFSWCSSRFSMVFWPNKHLVAKTPKEVLSGGHS